MSRENAIIDPPETQKFIDDLNLSHEHIFGETIDEHSARLAAFVAEHGGSPRWWANADLSDDIEMCRWETANGRKYTAK
jgi:hypothetical protein